MDYRREVDGLRAIAIIPVIFFHAGFQFFNGGFVGVDIFFVISGYLITSLILNEKKAGTFSLMDFYERRARRILPALFVIMFVCLPLAYRWLLPSDMKDFSQSLISVSSFTSNIYFFLVSGYFENDNELKPLLHTWSLAVEEQYYLLFPVFLLLTWQLGKQYILWLLITVASISLMIAQHTSFTNPKFAFYLLPSRGWEILIGSFSAFYLCQEKKPAVSLIIKQLMSIIGLLLILYSILIFDKQTPFPGIYALMPTLGTVFIIMFGTRDTIIGKVLGTQVCVGIGLISYSAYLWHQPLFAFARYISSDKPTQLLMGVLTSATLLLAYLTWRFIETPFRDKRRTSRRQIIILGVVCSLLFTILGSIGNFNNGFENRFLKNNDPVLFSKELMQQYTWNNFGSYILKKFDSSTKKRVLIIGDSFTGDLVNAIFENGLNNSIQISTYFIPSTCGNLYLTEDFSENIVLQEKSKCMKINWYNNNDLKKLMAEADSIWLASSWTTWVATLLPKSVSNLEKDYGEKILVFGGKRLYQYNLYQLLKIPLEDRLRRVKLIDAEQVKINSLMINTLPENIFINVSFSICGSETSCQLFTRSGDLIFYDIYHLTPAGAKLYGEKLLKYPSIRRLADKDI